MAWTSTAAGDNRLQATGIATVRMIAITDRRMMVTPDLACSDDWSAVAAAFGCAVQCAVTDCPVGSVLIQVREKDLDGGRLLALVRAAQAFAPVVVNDRLDVALAANAYGVHLPERGLPLAVARGLAPSLRIGVSRHGAPLDYTALPSGSAASPATAGLVDDDADLVQLGPIWPTPSKPGARVLGESALACARRTPMLVAVGGIDSPERAKRAAGAGADAAAVIRAAWSGASLAPYVAAVDAGLAERAR